MIELHENMLSNMGMWKTKSERLFLNQQVVGNKKLAEEKRFFFQKSAKWRASERWTEDIVQCDRLAAFDTSEKLE